jgi:ERCC4-type nuclease
LFSLSYFKGFSVYNSINNIESAEIIYGFISKMRREMNKEGFYNNEKNDMEVEPNNDEVAMEDVDVINSNDIEYVNVVKTSKKSNITSDNINVIMLMQIPNVSGQTSRAIMDKFKNVKNLVIDLERDSKCLDDIRIGSNNRKLGKNAIQSIKQLLLK